MRFLHSYYILTLAIMVFAPVTKTDGQIFSDEPWKEKNLISAKMSQLYYELNVGINIRPQRHSADFIYIAMGYGKATRKNAWRKFLPAKTIPETLSESQQALFMKSSTDNLHAGKVGIGWNHWFNHIVGIYVQANWGFVADLSSGEDLPDDVVSAIVTSESKETFIYNTVPVEAGITLNLWKHYHIQGGMTYQWKEIPLLTVGVGYAF